MNTFDITFNAAVQGFWGWWLLWGVMLLAASMFIASIVTYRTRGKFEGTSEGFLVTGAVAVFLSVFTGMGVSGALQGAEEETFREQRTAALAEAGYPLAIYDEEQTVLKHEDGTTALYTSITVQSGDDYTITYYQISE